MAPARSQTDRVHPCDRSVAQDFNGSQEKRLRESIDAPLKAHRTGRRHVEGLPLVGHRPPRRARSRTLASRTPVQPCDRWRADVLRGVVPVVVMAWSFRAQAGTLPAALVCRKKPHFLLAIHTLPELFEQELGAGHLAARDALLIARIITRCVWYFGSCSSCSATRRARRMRRRAGSAGAAGLRQPATVTNVAGQAEGS
jgi:hypothetical protein